RVKGLCKTYSRQKREPGLRGAVRYLLQPEHETIPAVQDLSFEIGKGEMVAYIGPNGAGKSTTVKMLVGILVPSAGTIEVAGLVPHEHRKENALRIGVVFGQRTRLWWDIPVRDSFALIRHMYQVPEATYAKNLELFREVLELDSWFDTPVRQLSLGQRMRADLSIALLHDPEILFLDEPTIGLDVEVKENIRELVRTLNRRRGTTVVLTTHDISDVEKLCDRVLVIDKGRLMFDGSLERLKREYGGEEVLSVDTRERIAASDLAALTEMPGVVHAEPNGLRLTLSYDPRVVNPAALVEKLMSRHKVVDFFAGGTEAEGVIRRMYRANAAQAKPEEGRHP
ncbi:MAG: ATP-binding cassette domain-containing protein, partial [Acidobacteriota bacterium]